MPILAPGLVLQRLGQIMPEQCSNGAAASDEDEKAAMRKDEHSGWSRTWENIGDR